MPSSKVLRIDFKQKLLSFEPNTGKFESILDLEPERYSKITVDGEEGFFDVFDRVFFPANTIEKIIAQIQGMPIYHSPPKVETMEEYVLQRISEVKKFLDSEKKILEFHDISEEFLSSLTKEKMHCVVLFIDIKGSTVLSQLISSEVNSKLISLFLSEVTHIVEKFNGFILKYVGDGVVAYFPEPDFPAMNDNAVECAVLLKKMILEGINPVLKSRNLPELNFGIGIDSGEAIVKTLGVENIKMHRDLIGETVNIAAKIQALSKNSEILIGESTVLNLHAFWRKKIIRLEIKETWDYKDKKSENPYQIYFFNN